LSEDQKEAILSELGNLDNEIIERCLNVLGGDQSMYRFLSEGDVLTIIANICLEDNISIDENLDGKLRDRIEADNKELNSFVKSIAARIEDEGLRDIIIKRIIRANEFYIKYQRYVGTKQRQRNLHLRGIDFVKPVKVIRIDQDILFTQITRPVGGWQGGYYSDKIYSPEQLGISPRVNMRISEAIKKEYDAFLAVKNDVDDGTVTIEKFWFDIEKKIPEKNDDLPLSEEYVVYKITKNYISLSAADIDNMSLVSFCAAIIDNWSEKTIVKGKVIPVEYPTKGGGVQFYAPNRDFFEYIKPLDDILSREGVRRAIDVVRELDEFSEIIDSEKPSDDDQPPGSDDGKVVVVDETDSSFEEDEADGDSLSFKLQIDIGAIKEMLKQGFEINEIIDKLYKSTANLTTNNLLYIQNIIRNIVFDD